MTFYNICSFIDKVIVDNSKAIKYRVDLSGSGEPLLELDLVFKINEYCRNKSNELRKEIIVMFVSNGYLLTNDIAKKLQKQGILFGISIDGYSRYHDSNRILPNGGKTYKKIIKNVKSIKNREFIGSAMTISNRNVDLVKAVKCLDKFFNTISIKISRSNHFLDVDYLKNQYKELTDYLISLISQGKYSILFKLLNGDDLFGRYIENILLHKKLCHRCDAGIGKFSLDTDKKVYICSAAVGIDELCIGQIDNIDYLKGRILQKNSFCKDCDFRFWCGGRCLVEQSQKYDDYCELRKYMIKLAFLLSATLEINFPFQLQIILSFLKEKNERFVGDKCFLLLVEKEKGLSFLELKNIYDFDKKRYNELLKKNMIKGENNDAKDCECNEEV